MRRLAAVARKVGEHLARRFRATSASGGPLPAATGRAAAGERKAPAKTRHWRRKASPVPSSQEPLPGGAGKLKVPAATRRDKVAPLPDAAGRKAQGEVKASADSSARISVKGKKMPDSQESGSGAASMPLPPTTRKALEEQFKAKMSACCGCEAFNKKVTRRLADTFYASPGSEAPSTSMPPPPPPPQSESFWFKVMMAGGASIAFLMDFLKGRVEKEVDLRLKEREIQEKSKLILEKDKDLELTKKELEIATKEQKQRRWFWL